MHGTNRSGKGGEEPAVWPRIWLTTRRERDKKRDDNKWDGPPPKKNIGEVPKWWKSTRALRCMNSQTALREAFPDREVSTLRVRALTLGVLGIFDYYQVYVIGINGFFKDNTF